MAPAASSAIKALCDAAGLDPVEPHDQTFVVLAGPFNSGKTTLVKRLLVEKELEVPEWATISGAPETTSSAHVALNSDLLLVDSPGLNSGSEPHEAAARDAIASADALLIVLLGPNPLTSELEDVVQLITGRHVHPDGWQWPEGAIHLVLTQLDQAGVDPLEDPEQFEAISAQKTSEVTAVLEEKLSADEAERAVAVPPIHVVVADPFGKVANDTAELAYERGPWDGVDRLITVIEDLDGPLLRQASAVRQVIRAASTSSSAYRDASEALQLDVDRLKIRKQQLERESRERSARAEAEEIQLRTRLDAFLASLSVTDDEQILKQEIIAITTAWFEEQHEWLGEQLDRVEGDQVELDTRKRESSRFWEVTGALAENADEISGQITTIIETAMGMSVEDMKREIAEAKEAGREYFEKADRLFPGEIHLKGADAALKALDLLPVAAELYSTIQAIRGTGGPEHETQRNKLKKVLRKQCSELADQARKRLDEAIEAMNDGEKKELAAIEKDINQGETAITGFEVSAARIDELIAEVRALVEA